MSDELNSHLQKALTALTAYVVSLFCNATYIGDRFGRPGSRPGRSGSQNLVTTNPPAFRIGETLIPPTGRHGRWEPAENHTELCFRL